MIACQHRATSKPNADFSNRSGKRNSGRDINCLRLCFPGIERGVGGRTFLAYVQPAEGLLDRRSEPLPRERMMIDRLDCGRAWPFVADRFRCSVQKTPESQASAAITLQVRQSLWRSRRSDPLDHHGADSQPDGEKR